MIISAAQANADHRPQPTPGFTRIGRRLHARATARAAHASIHKLTATGVARPTGRALVAEANRQLGKGYSASTPCRCSDACGRQDCSGLVSGARNAVAVPFGFPAICMSSFGFGPMCRAAGRLVSEDYAIRTPGCIGIENAWGSSNGPLGTNGHIVIFTGVDIDGNPTDDPRQLVTIEEMGTRYGCVHGPAIGRGFNAWAELPDFDYTPPPPPVDWDAVRKLVAWRNRVAAQSVRHGGLRVTGSLRAGDTDGDVTILNLLLVKASWMPAPAHMNTYTLQTVNGVAHMKNALQLPDRDGTHFGGPAADALLAPKP